MGKKLDFTDGGKGLSSSFSELLKGIDKSALPDVPVEGAPAAPTQSPADAVAGASLRLVLETKGHGGKTVTRVTGFNPGDASLKDAAKQLARKLGCGVKAMGLELVVQGDQRERLEGVLKQMGAKEARG